MTLAMEQFRRCRSEEAFNQLFALAGPVLLRRIRLRLRRTGFDADEGDVLQETLLNVYRYPHRFRCERPGSFKAWSGAIMENAIRRMMRRRLARREWLDEGEVLEATPDALHPDPSTEVAVREDSETLRRSWLILLGAYLRVYTTLSTRERLALQMVEVESRRYKDVAVRVGVRPEALKMVVFRARKRIYARLCRALDPLPLPGTN